MKRLINYIYEALVNEGGNAVTANPIPAPIAPLVYKKVEDMVHKKYPKIDMAALGSLGKKLDNQTNGDIDIAITVKDKEELNAILFDVFDGYEINTKVTNQISSISFPYNEEGHSGNAQVDFMITNNMKWAKWRYASPDFKKNESKYKAAVKDYILRCIVAAIPVKDTKKEFYDGGQLKSRWRHIFNFEGVYKSLEQFDLNKRTGEVKKGRNEKVYKEFKTLVENDPDNVMRFLCGENFDEKDFNSAESLWAMLHNPNKFLYGKDVVKEAETMFYDKFINGRESAVELHREDFPCQYYKEDK